VIFIGRKCRVEFFTLRVWECLETRTASRAMMDKWMSSRHQVLFLIWGFFVLLIALTYSTPPTPPSFLQSSAPSASPPSSFNILYYTKFISYLHSVTFSWSVGIIFWEGVVFGFWDCGGTLQYGLEFEVVACIRTVLLMCEKCVLSNTHLTHI
jgi:hypothetical protein